MNQAHASFLGLRLPALALIVGATAIPIGLHRPEFSAHLGALNPFDIWDFGENILGYLPLGAALAACGVPRAIAASIVLSVGIEAAQSMMLFRSPSVLDVIANVAGAAIGVAAARRWSIQPRLKLGAASALAAALVAVGLSISAFLTNVQPASERGFTVPGRLEAAWSFDESHRALVGDGSGNGLSGRIKGMAKGIPGPRGRALSVTGSGGVSFGVQQALRLKGSMSVTAWIRARSFPADDAAILSSYNGQGFQLDTTNDTGKRTFGFKLANTCGDTVSRYSRASVHTGVWYHVAGVFDASGAAMHVYVNGAADDGVLEGEVTHGQKDSRDPIQVGKRGRFDTFNFDGDIDEVHIYSFALTVPEVLSDMRGELPRGGQLTPVLQPDECPWAPDVGDARLPAVGAVLGFLAVFSWLGLVSIRSSLRLLLAATPALATVLLVGILKPHQVLFAVSVSLVLSALATALSSTVGGSSPAGTEI